MNHIQLSRTGCLCVLLFWLISSQRIQAQTTSQADSLARRDTVSTPGEHTWPGFGLASRRQEDSVKAVFVREKQLTRAFRDFYKTSTGEWFFVHYRFGIDEGEQYIFTVTPCPVLDSATFKVHDGYWQDRNGVYYAATTLIQPYIATLPGVDLTTFKSLGFEHLGIDKHHVFQLGVIRSGLHPSTLKIYTPGGQLTEDWDLNTSAYLISGNVIYNPDWLRLTAKQAARFRLPRGYRLAYPLQRRPTRKSK